MEKILKFITNIIFNKKPVYTQKYIDHPEMQVCEVLCYHNNKYTHTVNLFYFTKQQVETLHNIQEGIHTKNKDSRQRKRIRRKKKKKCKKY